MLTLNSKKCSQKVWNNWHLKTLPSVFYKTFWNTHGLSFIKRSATFLSLDCFDLFKTCHYSEKIKDVLDLGLYKNSFAGKKSCKQYWCPILFQGWLPMAVMFCENEQALNFEIQIPWLHSLVLEQGTLIHKCCFRIKWPSLKAVYPPHTQTHFSSVLLMERWVWLNHLK